MVGAAIGAAPGLLLTFGDYNDAWDTPSAAVVAAMGAAGGALVGAAVGWAFKAEQWRNVGVPAADLAITPLRHGVAASLRVVWGARRQPSGSNSGPPNKRMS